MPKWNARRTWCALQVTPVLILALSAGFATAAPSDEVKALFERGEARQAYELGRKTPEQLGNPAFDYYFGLAAIDSGAVGDGVLALERYLLNNPGSVSARLELGRGYFLMGDNVRARQMFEEVGTLSPPADAAARIKSYLDAIRERENSYRTAVTGFAELGGGHDSNVNGGISQDSINVPIFGPVTVDPLGREIADRFWSVAAGVNLNVPLSARAAFFAGLSAENRSHADADAFDQRTYGGALGSAFKRADDQFRASLSGGRLDVDGEQYRTVKAATFEWNRSLGSSQGVGLFAQVAGIDYQGDNRVRDSRLYTVGASWRRSLEGDWRPFVSASLVGARERNNHDRDDLARNLVGARVGLGLTINAQVNAAFSASYQQSRYQEADVFFGERRRDRYASVEAAAGYAFTPNLGLRLELGYFDNRSNIELFRYDRFVAAVKLRYDFR
ncbi:MAG: hypothetical protein ABIQ72_08765 [Usitatibacter sp.]